MMATSWNRPEGVVNIWKKLELTMKNSDGSNKIVRVQIQDVPPDPYRRDEAIQLKIKNFLTDEPLCQNMGLHKEPDAVRDSSQVWEMCLDQGIVVGAYLVNDKGELIEIIGTNLLYVPTAEFKTKLDKLLKNPNTHPKVVKLFQILDELIKKAEPDFRRICGDDLYMDALGLTVSRDYRGHKLGYELLKTRNIIGHKYNLGASETVFTAEASQREAAKAGFVSVYEVEYETLVDKRGQPVFPGIKEKTLKIMAKRLGLSPQEKS